MELNTSTTVTSPKILKVKWGKLEVENLGPGKDYKLWPGGGRGWDWGETGTNHSPGIQIKDCEELVARGCSHVVLSRGVFSRLKVPETTIAFLEEKGITVITCDTKKAVKQYNELAGRGEKVGGLFHSTC